MPLVQTHKYNPNIFAPPAPPYHRITYPFMTAFSPSKLLIAYFIRFQLIKKVGWGRGTLGFLRYIPAFL